MRAKGKMGDSVTIEGKREKKAKERKKLISRGGKYFLVVQDQRKKKNRGKRRRRERERETRSQSREDGRRRKIVFSLGKTKKAQFRAC